MPEKTIFKKGAAAQIALECLEFGGRGLIVHGSSLEKSGRKDKIVSQFPSLSKTACFCRPAGEPDLQELAQVKDQAKALDARWIAGIGGGSVLDVAKAAAGLYHAKQPAVFYQEGGALKEPGIPFIAVPTTAGTGSEATANSVIINKENKTKLSIRDKRFLAKKVILDPELLLGSSFSVLSYAGMDALVQGYESFISKNATWFSETFALKAIELINENLISACESADEESLSCLLLGSYLAGIAFNASRLGVIHGIAHPLGVMYGLPHGLICSVCFIPSIKLNKNAISGKYDTLSRITGGDFLQRIDTLLGRLKIKSPFKGKVLIEKEKIIRETLFSGSTAANPRQVTAQDVECILEEIF